MSGDIDLTQVLPLARFVERHPDLGKSVAAVRWEVFRADENGLSKAGAVIRQGRRVYICVPRYRDWLLAHGANGCLPAA